ncbi:MAG: hypothetical protein WC943_16005 [Elusimicrobiota bacterium]
MNAEPRDPTFARRAGVAFSVLGLLLTGLYAGGVYLTGSHALSWLAIPLGLLLLAVGLPLNIRCLVMIMRRPAPDTDEELAVESRLIRNTLFILLSNYFVAAFGVYGFFRVFELPLGVVRLDNASGMALTQVSLIEPYGKGPAWTALRLEAGEKTTARFLLRKDAGDGKMHLAFHGQGSARTCEVPGFLTPRHPGHGRARVKPDFSCD